MAAVTVQKLVVREQIITYFKEEADKKDIDELKRLVVALADSCAARMSLSELTSWRNYLYK